jgi:hypothetical protein
MRLLRPRNLLRLAVIAAVIAAVREWAFARHERNARRRPS